MAERAVGISKAADKSQAADDDLSDRAAARGDYVLMHPESAVMAGLKDTSEWARNRKKYSPAATPTLKQDAGRRFAAHAPAHGRIMVTREVSALTASKIRMPEACISITTRHLIPFGRHCRERAEFVLGNGRAAA